MDNYNINYYAYMSLMKLFRLEFTTHTITDFHRNDTYIVAGDKKFLLYSCELPHLPYNSNPQINPLGAPWIIE